LLVTNENKTAYAWSFDGRTLLYGTQNPETGADIWAVPLTADRKPHPVVQTSAAEDAAQFSPDGRWVAYESNETGRFEIYVQAFPTPRGKW
jgi:Tol biopolymer transport system component